MINRSRAPWLIIVVLLMGTLVIGLAYRQEVLVWATGWLRFIDENRNEFLIGLIFLLAGVTLPVVAVYVARNLKAIQYSLLPQELKAQVDNRLAQERIYLADLRVRIRDQASKWNVKKYVEMDYSSEDEVQPEFKELRWWVWRGPHRSESGEGNIVVYSEPANKPAVQLSTYLKQHRRLIVKGEPGSGKTMALRRLAMKELDRALINPETPLPILVELSNYREVDEVSGEPIEVIDFLRAYLAAEHPEIEILHSGLEQTLARRPVTFIFDGLNEMPPSDYSERVRKLEDFSRQRRKHRFVFSCRTLHYDPLLEATAITIMPLDNRRMKGFLRSYLAQPDRANEVFDQLHPQVLEACRTPLVLYMLAQSIAASTAAPKDQASIFEAFVTFLYRKNSVSVDVASELSNAFCELAFLMISEKLHSASIETSWLYGRLPDATTTVLIEHGIQSGILDGAASGRLKFTHHMLQEFFAAKALAGLFNAGESVYKYLADFWWKEVIVIASGLVNSPDHFVETLVSNEKFTLLSDQLQKALSTAAGKDQWDVIEYLYRRSRTEWAYGQHYVAALMSLYSTAYSIGNQIVRELQPYDRLLLVAMRVVGLIRGRLSADVVAMVIHGVESRLVFGDVYQRAGAIENCRYIGEDEGLALMRWSILDDRNPRYTRSFWAEAIETAPERLFPLFDSLVVRRQLPLINMRRWLKEMALVNMTSIKTDVARLEIARTLQNELRAWDLFWMISSRLSTRSLIRLIIDLVGWQRLRVFGWGAFSMLMLGVVVNLIGLQTSIALLVVLVPLIGGAWFFLVFLPLTRRALSARRDSTTSDKFGPRPKYQDPIPYRQILTRSATQLLWISSGLIGLTLILIVGIIPSLTLAVTILAAIVLRYAAPQYLSFIRDPIIRDSIVQSVFAVRNRYRLPMIAMFYMVLVGGSVWLLQRNEALPFALLGLGGLFLETRVGIRPSMLSWAIMFDLLLFLPAWGGIIWAVLGSWLQLFDIDRMGRLLSRTGSHVDYRGTDEELVAIAVNSRRWAVARSRAIKAISQSPFAAEHLPILDQIVQGQIEATPSVQEAAEQAIFEIRKRSAKGIVLPE